MIFKSKVNQPGKSFSPVGYYRLGQSYPRSMARQAYPFLAKTFIDTSGVTPPVSTFQAAWASQATRIIGIINA